MKKMNKKAAIEMSINTIVVLVLALAMLGVGLFVIQRVREGAEALDVTEEVKSQMYDKLESSGAKLVLDKKEITMKTTDREEYYYAIKNVFGEQETFSVDIDCEYCIKDGCDPDDINFYYIEEVNLNPNENIVHPFTIDPSGASPDFYSCKVNVTSNGQAYALERFNLRIE
ncbi:MAG: hypothetical protein PWQ87_398 [Candidatus Woesearchaeota archaeon]|nr:hypothetical protein [Candidatus Woesearchaeota archaeon]